MASCHSISSNTACMSLLLHISIIPEYVLTSTIGHITVILNKVKNNRMFLLLFFYGVYSCYSGITRGGTQLTLCDVRDPIHVSCMQGKHFIHRTISLALITSISNSYIRNAKPCLEQSKI